MTKKQVWNDGWSFVLQPLGTPLQEAVQAAFTPINIPHDWQIYDTTDLYEDGMGWYRKQFFCEDTQQRYEIYFEGVYMDCGVYVNRKLIGEWKYGYSSFYFDITQALQEGENEILVRVTYQSPNSRWYSGAGIYRNVWLIQKPRIAFATDGIYITPVKTKDGLWQVEVQAELEAADASPQELLQQIQSQMITMEITDCKERAIIASVQSSAAQAADAYGEQTNDCLLISLTATVTDPSLWSLQEPNLYECCLHLEQEDTVRERFGFREITFDTNKGLFLNGKAVKLNGACEHHDLGALGAAYYQKAMRRKLEILREMGINSIRTTHNMPAVGLLELADEMGFLVVDEAFDMWERSKTEYDYARFFPEWYQRDVRNWVRRDRNHACLLFWSIGNEIYDTHADDRGQVVTRLLAEETRKHDPKFHGQITIGSNFMPWENARKCADIVKFAGYNYGEKYYEEHHEEHPDWYLYGSETASTVQSRGIYHFPYRQSVLADDDEQCSSLGNSTTSWGAKSSEACILTERDHAFSMGQFLWSGFDYIGEPTPYHTRNSYFGQIDTAGFPKDSFYIYQSAWTDVKEAPMVHLFPYWDFNKGQMVDVRVASNAPVVELFLNGVSQGTYEIDHEKGTQLTGNWILPYEEGEITAVAYDSEHREIARETRHSFGDARRLVLEVWQEEKTLEAGTYDLAFAAVSAVDENGYPVENANNLVHVEVTGAGWLAGLDNGDSTDTQQYKGYDKRLFSGKLLAIVAAGAEEGRIELTVSGEGLESAKVVLEVKKAKRPLTGASLLPEHFQEQALGKDAALWVRKIELTTPQGQILSPQQPELIVTAQLLPPQPKEVQNELIWRAVNDAGIESPIAVVKPLTQEELAALGLDAEYGARITAKGDGAFRLRCMTRNGTDKVKVISQIELTARDLGEACLDPYGFIAGGMYTYAEGEAGNGNEHGVSTARDGRTVVGFDRIDFGSFGSDQITLPIFELGGDVCPIEIWEGIPGQEDSSLLAQVVYHKPSIWNTYQEETYQLSRRVKGITQICFVLQQKIHLKGFSFARQEKAYAKLHAGENDAIYGDSFLPQGREVHAIGNNVTLEYTDMEFDEEGCSQITICGRTPNDINTIHISFSDEEQETRQIVEFAGSKDWQERTFTLPSVQGKKTVRFIFLPGSKFDFSWFQFSK